MTAPTIWLLSAYRGDSHAAWADWLTPAVTDVCWHRFELPGRHFRWRIRGNPLSWLDALPAEPPDAIIATSMVDLATLRGLHAHLARVPVAYYFHENQFAYPVSDKQVRSLEPQIVQLYGALSADSLVFNSEFNRSSFLNGVTSLIRRMPDQKPHAVSNRLEQRAEVLPVPIEPLAPGPERDPRLIVWNHRWEYDKMPELFAAAMEALAARGVDFRLALLGWRPSQPPPALERLRNNLGSRIRADGRVPRSDYHRLLAQAGIVVSTAEHEFQGLAILEAVSAGARPLVPDDLCYREQYPDTYRYPPGDQQALVARLRTWLEVGLPAAPDVSGYYVDALRGTWSRLLHQLCGRRAVTRA